MLTKIFVKPLWKAHHLKEKKAEQVGKILETTYKKQWSLVVKVNREMKLQYFNNLEHQRIRNLLR